MDRSDIGPILHESGNRWRCLRIAFAATAFLIGAEVPVQAQWNSSPYNFQNSPYNFNNSPYNFQNSPYNFQNSPYNWNGNRGIYDNEGNRAGYAVPRPDGGVN